jgi:HAD superfamily hydrolase (TIGR01549 family)
LKFNGIRNVIFDLDGTLIDSSEGVVEATNYALRSIGESARAGEEIRRFIGYPLEEMFRAFSDKSYREFWQYFQDRAKDSVAASARPLLGADEVLRKLHNQGYRLGIATTKIRIHIEKILAKYGWTDLVRAYVGADDVDRVKPDPEIFNRLQKLLGGSRSDTIVVGDTVNDVYAARRASLPVIVVRSPYGGDDELRDSRPDVILNNLMELPDILEQPGHHAAS